MKRALGLLISVVLTCCVSSANVPEDSQWSAAALNALCGKFPRQYGENRAVVANSTRPVIDLAALQAVTSPTTADTARRTIEDESRVRDAFKPQEITVGAGVACVFTVRPMPARYIDELLIEMSGPMENPYDGSLGTFVRSSAGGRPGAIWMWVQLTRTGTSWKVAKVVTLPVNDG